jgi:hypothetical protein
MPAPKKNVNKNKTDTAVSVGRIYIHINEIVRIPMKTSPTHLASEIATALKDNQAFSLHLTYAEKYPEDVLRTILSFVLSHPAEKISSSRAAYYNYLVKQYERTGHYPRH